jgi:hypothetical protein
MAKKADLYIATTSSAVIVDGESDFVRAGDLAYPGASILDGHGDLFRPVGDDDVKFRPAPAADEPEEKSEPARKAGH